jgi:hypothetical protein
VDFLDRGLLWEKCEVTSCILGWTRNTLYPLKLALASLTGGDRSIGIVRLRTKNHGDDDDFGLEETSVETVRRRFSIITNGDIK